MAYSCRYPVVWCPKYCRKVLVISVDVRLKEIIRQTAQGFHRAVIELETMPDHMHLLWEVDPQFGIHRLVRYLKGRLSHQLPQEYPWLSSHMSTLWTNSYFGASVGGAPLAVIKRYIENQKSV